MSTPRAATIDVGRAIEGQGGGQYARLILIACAIAMVVEGYDAQVLAYAAPAIIKDWHVVDKSLFGPVFGAALFGYMIGATLLSGISDSFGRKRVIVAGNLGFGLLTLATAWSGTLTELLVLRFLAGLGLGCAIPAAIALAAEYAPEGRRAFRISLLFVGYTAGAAFGGFVTAALMSVFGWRSAFLFGGALSLVIALAAVLVLPESARFLALLGGRDGEIAAIMRRLRPDLGITPATRFTAAEHAAAGGLPVRHLFTEGRAWLTTLLWAAFITSLAGHYFLTSWLPTVLNGNGIELSHAVVAGALIQGGGAFGSLIVGRLVDRIGLGAIVGAYVLSIPFVILIGAVEMPEPMLMSVVFMAGLCLLGGQIGLNALAGTLYPTFVRSSGAGWALGVGRIGSILGPVIGGVLIGAGLPTPALFVCAAIPAGFSAAAVLALARIRGREGVGVVDRGARMAGRGARA